MSDKLETCALCGNQRNLCDSHVIPKFVYDRIKKNSPTGYLRRTDNINKRLQDGEKHQILCHSCEQRFSRAENQFAQQAFEPFMNESVPPLDYGEWLYYFITSVTWRALYLDLPSLRQKYAGKAIIITFEQAEQNMRKHLLGQNKNISPAENHVFFMGTVVNTSSDISNDKPNVFGRCSAFPRTFFEADACYVYANLAGILVVTVIRRHEKDIWQNTEVDWCGGRITIPQNITSPLGNDFNERNKEAFLARFSPGQQRKLEQFLEKNPHAATTSKAAQFHLADAELRRKHS